MCAKEEKRKRIRMENRKNVKNGDQKFFFFFFFFFLCCCFLALAVLRILLQKRTLRDNA